MLEIDFHMMTVPGYHPARDLVVSEADTAIEDLRVHADHQRNGVVWNWAQTMMAMASDPGADWCVQLQDDMTLLDGWRGHLEEALTHSPSPILGLAWLGVRRGARAFEKGKAYAVGHHLPSGYAVAYRAEVIRPLARFSHAVSLTGYRHDDAAMTTWAKHVGIETALVSRSLFGQADAKSMLGHAQYGTALYTIETHPHEPMWDAGSLQENYLATREDEETVLNGATEQGWYA